MIRNTQPARHPHGEQLSAYGDGMLDVAKTRAVAEHLRVCTPCTQIVSQLEQTKSLLRAMPVPARPGPEFWNSAYRRLRVTGQKPPLRRMPWATLRGAGQTTQRRLAAGLAAAAVIAAAVAAGPSVTNVPSAPLPVSTSTLPQDDTPDVSALVESHTDSVSRLPLADPDRQKMIAADARQSQDAPEGAAYADSAF